MSTRALCVVAMLVVSSATAKAVACSRDLTSTSVFHTKSLTDAAASFCGDKFVFRGAPGLLVCQEVVQRRAYAAFAGAGVNASLAALFTGSLTSECVEKFGVRGTPFGPPAVLLRASEVLPSGDCLVYAMSAAAVYCVRRTGDVREFAWQTPSAVAKGTLVDVAVHGAFVVRTVLSSGVSRYVSLLSQLGSTSEVVLRVAGLVMFARAAPQYFLRQDTGGGLYLSLFEAPGNATFSMNATERYSVNDVRILCSTYVPIDGSNTVLEYHDGFVVFATAKYSSAHVFLYLATLNVSSAALDTYSMPVAVFDLASDGPPARVSDAYEGIAYAATAMLSCAWLGPRTLVLSVAIADTDPGQFQPLVIDVADLALGGTTMHPYLARTFDAPFVRMGTAVVSAGALRTCSECEAASGEQAVSGFFAYGASPVSYRRLVACKESGMYVEERISQSLPIRSCTEVYLDALDGGTSPVVSEMTLTCVSADRIEVVLELAAGSELTFATNERYSPATLVRLLLSGACQAADVVRTVTVSDTGVCAAGCLYSLAGGKFQINGAVVIESVRQRPPMSAASEAWHRRAQLQRLVERESTQTVGRAWQEHSTTTRRIAPLQRFDVAVERALSVARLADLRGGDSNQRLALDALAVLPVLSERLVHVAEGSKTWGATIVYVPSTADLSVLDLQAFAFGDDELDWARVHASVHVSVVPADVRQCKYAARLVAVDSALRFVRSARATGCVLDLALSPQCHVELPLRLASAASVVGLELHALTADCPPLSEAHDVSVELAPFMRVSQCPPNQFLDADTLACALCDDGDADCPAGQHVSGCRPLLHPQTAPQCIACAAPDHSTFPPTSQGCAAWQCQHGHYRDKGACAPCTSLLASGATACRTTGGRRFEPCTALENEKCVDCAAKPRYTEWFVADTDAAECTWRCKDGYFASGGGCERCLTFEETKATLATGGTLAAGALYRFEGCSASAQARWEVCAETDFTPRLDGKYLADGRAFGEDCVMECSANSNLHGVRENVTREGREWRAVRCVECAHAAWPVSVAGARLPRGAFEMSSSCVPTCLSSAGFFASSDPRTCLFCPRDACPRGTFWSALDNCTECAQCSRRLAGSEFSRAGAFNDADSCGEQCPAGSFQADDKTCRPHSAVACRSGLEYAIAGTPTTDARCGTCADCSGARETVACTPTSNRECASCGPLDSWSGSWSKTGCELVCRTVDGYTKLHTAQGEVCRKCLPCELGQERPAAPASCACQPCSAPLPALAMYTAGCAWTCPAYHVARTVDGALACEYTLRQTSNAPSYLRAESPVLCPPGQRLVEDPRKQAYAGLTCEPCATPPGMRTDGLGVTWTWGRSCAWQCAWNLEKQLRLGVFSCVTMKYTHSQTGPAPAPKGGLSAAHVVGMLMCIVVVAIVGLCAWRAAQAF